MRVPGLIVLGVLGAVVALPPAAKAQFSPQGIVGAATAPLRDMLGHFPRGRRHAAPARHATSALAAALSPRLARLGPPAWSSAYADVLGYVFWPGDYGRDVRDRGFDVIAHTITGPFSAAATTGAVPRDSAGECGGAVGGATNDWPQAQVEKTSQLIDSQRQALQKFQAALEQSTKPLRVDCTNPGDSSSPARLGGLIQALWAVRDTGLFVRQPLIEFDNSLSDTQKTAFAAPIQATPQPAAANAASKEMQACAAQNIGEAERMVKVIGARVRPDKRQSASLEDLHKVSVDMARLLAATCARPVPPDFVSRLDAIDDQLTTMNYAATSVQIAFADFYRRLDARQKSRVNSAR
jgi:hypothetical protein